MCCRLPALQHYLDAPQRPSQTRCPTLDAQHLANRRICMHHTIKFTSNHMSTPYSALPRHAMQALPWSNRHAPDVKVQPVHLLAVNDQLPHDISADPCGDDQQHQSPYF